MKIKNNSGYSVILALLMVGFMIVLTTGVFLLVLKESKDTKAMENYLKAFAGAEGAIELGMLKSKNYSYSIDYSVPHTVNNESIVLAKDPLNTSTFLKTKDVFISYDINSTSNDINKDLKNGKFDIIPLFFYDSNGNLKKITNLSLTSNSPELVWNIVGDEEGISGKGNFTNSTEGNLKTVSGNEVSFSKKYISDFLSSSNKNYLILHNATTETISYNLRALNSGEYFTNFTNEILGSGEVSSLKQNLILKIDSSEYLNLLKYSIFSN